MAKISPFASQVETILQYLHTAMSMVTCICRVTVTEEGEVYACGSDYWGCLGQGQPVEQEKSYTVPVPVLLPERHQVEQISCGDAHVVALTSESLAQCMQLNSSLTFICSESKEVLSWGCGEFGQSVLAYNMFARFEITMFRLQWTGRLGLGSEMNVSSPQKVGQLLVVCACNV